MNDKIIQKIKNSSTKSITYDTFIELALYHPNEGYYSVRKEKIGKDGDFYTSSVINDVFGEVFANHFITIADNNDLPLTICEIGGGDGRFAYQIMKYLEQKDTSFTYIMIEASADHQERAIAKMDKSWDFSVYASIESFLADQNNEGIEGIIFSNEWLDAQPVKVIEKRENKLVEVMITLGENDELEEEFNALTPSLYQWIEANLQFELTEGQRIELPLYMDEQVDKLNELLNRGIIYTIDYGYTSEEWKHPARKKGSLRGYYQHQMKNNVLERIGEMDITHHVHWDYWKTIGEEKGLEFVIKIKQNEFLVKSGIMKLFQQHQNPNPFSEEQKRNRAIRSFIMGDGLATAFDVVIQSKGINTEQFQKAYD